MTFSHNLSSPANAAFSQHVALVTAVHERRQVLGVVSWHYSFDQSVATDIIHRPKIGALTVGDLAPRGHHVGEVDSLEFQYFGCTRYQGPDRQTPDKVYGGRVKWSIG